MRYAQKGPLTKARAVYELTTVVGPDGEIYYLAAADHHRIAAAKLRGDKYIPVYQIEYTDRYYLVLLRPGLNRHYKKTTSRKPAGPLPGGLFYGDFGAADCLAGEAADFASGVLNYAALGGVNGVVAGQKRASTGALG
jgi:hypothetical protein